LLFSIYISNVVLFLTHARNLALAIFFLQDLDNKNIFKIYLMTCETHLDKFKMLLIQKFNIHYFLKKLIFFRLDSRCGGIDTYYIRISGSILGWQNT